MIRGSWLAGIVGILVALLLVPVVRAQPASPAASPVPFPTVACTVDPLPFDDFIAYTVAPPGITVSTLMGTPVSTPNPPTGGTAASEEVVVAVTATLQQMVACVNAGDTQRLFTLYSDAFLSEFLGGIATLNDDFDEAEVRQEFGNATPVPIPPDQAVRLDAVDDVRLLPDGRVSAVIRVNDDRNLIIFAETGGRYLLDYSYELPDAATPTP